VYGILKELPKDVKQPGSSIFLFQKNEEKASKNKSQNGIPIFLTSIIYLKFLSLPILSLIISVVKTLLILVFSKK